MFINWVLLLAHSSLAQDEFIYRLELEDAITMATEDPHKQALLRRIAWFESNWRPDVGRCKVQGDHGHAFGPWQVHPRNRRERLEICGDTHMAASIALSRIEESLAACAHLPEPERLAAFCSGICTNKGGRVASRRRWVSASP